VSETYAIIRDGGRELKVAEGECVLVDLRPVEAGDEIRFSEVLLVGGEGEPRIGRPLVEGAAVVGEVTRQVGMEKLHPYKFKRRKGFHKKIGHRQKMLEVLVRSIETGASA
jgi:large subunit ribosomal protein L21